jgi:uncharacterized membrane protein
MKRLKIKELVVFASVAAIYVVLTWLLGSLSFGPIQFRIAEALVLLCFFNKKYIPSLVIGCAIANMFSPFGIYDIIFGTFATLISVICMSKTKNMVLASVFPVIFNGIIIAIEILLFDPSVTITFGSFISLASTIMLGEFVVVTILGVLIFKSLEKNEYFIENVFNI